MMPPMSQSPMFAPIQDPNRAPQILDSRLIDEVTKSISTINPTLLSQPARPFHGAQGAMQPMAQSPGFANLAGLSGGGFGGGFAGLATLGGFGGSSVVSSTPSTSTTNTTAHTRIPSREISEPVPQPVSQPVPQPIQSTLTQPVTLDILLKGFNKEYDEVSQELKTRIIFSLNNCSNTNIDEKSVEIRNMLVDDKSIRWFAKYIVYQRAPLESNFHSMYINLVTRIGRKEIFTFMIKDTYTILNKVLESDKVFGTPEKSYIQGNDKNSLKNMGSWLGQLTIARNKPIVMKDFDVKTLILEAYDNQKLDYMLPLVCKILAHGNQLGSVFKPKNAWMNAILSILAEIAQMSEIKMALKCEIQVLLNNFGLNEADVPSSKLIQRRKYQTKANASRDVQDPNGARISDLTLNELPQYVNIDQKITNLLPNLKTIVAQALDRAIK